MLKIVYDYSLKWRFKFNYDKCGVVIFENKISDRSSLKYGKCQDTKIKECKCGHHFKFGPYLINEVLSYI